MIMNGGYLAYNSTRYTSDGETFADLPPMPPGLFSHCVVALDGNDLFVTGGYTYLDYYGQYLGSVDSSKSFLYHSDTMEWEEIQDIPTPRLSLMCAMVHNINGGQDVITAGGYDDKRFNYDQDLDLVEIYNLQTGQWRTGQSM